MAGLEYDRVIRYDLALMTDGPLRIGSADKEGESVLIHPVDGKPFIQSSSLVGALRNHCRIIGINVDELFGSALSNEGVDSRVKVSDGQFCDKVEMELRPHVRINRKTGSASFEEVKGTNKVSGQKFNMEYVGIGQRYAFSAYLYDRSQNSLEEDFEKALAGIANRDVRFGGKKSSGAGLSKLEKASKEVYELRKPEDLKRWIRSERGNAEDITEKLTKMESHGMVYSVLVSGKTEAGIQIKGLAENNFGEDAADSSNIRNCRNEYIVPGSSFKGTIRSRMEMIAEYLKISEAVADTFGTNEVDGHAGNIFFRDAVIGDAASIDRIPTKHRLHLNKFTGGVMNPFQEHNAAGEIEFVVDISDFGDPQKTLGLLLLALRDLAIGSVSVGNGYANGKGFITVKNICVKDLTSSVNATIDLDTGTITDECGLVERALSTLKRGADHE